MLKRGLLFLASVLVIAAAVLLAPRPEGRADKDDTVAAYKPVADWPQLPDDIKFGEVAVRSRLSEPALAPLDRLPLAGDK
jgi:hypothetical protein